jgi:pimeloyl-ACP methyl ester carboxylesterase
MPLEMNIENINYPLDELSIAGLACGDKNAEIVLCLHGWLDNAASFTPLMPFMFDKVLSSKGFKERRIIAIDWYGHGFSSHRSADAHYHFIDWVYDLLQLFEANQWQNIDIVAHSMGGMIASAFAAAFPEKVKSLTLLDSIGFISAEADQSTKQLRQGLQSRLKNSALYLSRQKIKKGKSLHPSLDSAVKARVAVSDMNYQQAKIIVERGLLQSEQGFLWRADSRLRMTSPYRLTLSQAEQFIKDINCPVQLIYGSKGIDLVSTGIKHFAPMFKDFSRYELEGGHHVHMEKPEETAKLIANFIG